MLGDNNPRAMKRALNLWEFYQQVQLVSEGEGSTGEAPDSDAPSAREDALWLQYTILLFRIKMEHSARGVGAYENMVRSAQPHDFDDSENSSVTAPEAEVSALVRELSEDEVYWCLLRALRLPRIDEGEDAALTKEETERAKEFSRCLTDISRRLTGGRAVPKGAADGYQMIDESETLSWLRSCLATRFEERPFDEKCLDHFSSDGFDGYDRGEQLACLLRLGDRLANVVFYFNENPKPRAEAMNASLGCRQFGADDADGNKKRFQPLFSGENRMKDGRWYVTLACITDDAYTETLEDVLGYLLD